ncbi:MAG: hypothetical protein D6761_13190 [Candidatus Dadabacteria bacterium]|nr:MAG: hypothetical protein D6761_13190 [Candidatus Dadabacteria bacterium]
MQNSRLAPLFGALLKRDLLRDWIPARAWMTIFVPLRGGRWFCWRSVRPSGDRVGFARPKPTKRAWGRGWAAPPAAGFPGAPHHEPGETDLG